MELASLLGSSITFFSLSLLFPPFHSSLFYFISSLCVCVCVWKAINRHGFQQINHPESVNGKFARMNPPTFLYRVVFACAPVPAKKKKKIKKRPKTSHEQGFWNCYNLPQSSFFFSNKIQMGRRQTNSQEDVKMKKEARLLCKDKVE